METKRDFLYWAKEILTYHELFEMHIYSKLSTGDEFSSIEPEELAEFLTEIVTLEQLMEYASTHYGAGFIMGQYYLSLMEGDFDDEI